MIQINVKLPIEYDDEYIKNCICKRLSVTEEKIKEIRLLKREIITGDEVCFKATVGIAMDEVEEEQQYKKHHSVKEQMAGTAVSKTADVRFYIKKVTPSKRPIVVGCGPAGLFAALILAESGARPILLERGLDVDKRIESVDKFNETGELDENSNIQFGEGGAGTFSDGKLKPGKVDKYKFKVLSEFVKAGAPDDILYLTNAHIGTDKLREVVKKLRKKIISLGGEVIFSARVTDALIKDDAIYGVKANVLGEEKELYADEVIFATGHSARDVFELMQNRNISLEQKSFGVGVRVEHPQERIDKIKFGAYAGNKKLGAASYKLVTHLKNGRNVYSFCMCPGGSVVAATSLKNSVVTNGMSCFARDGANSNSAFLVTVFKEDFKSDDPLAGLSYQKEIEMAAYSSGGGGYRAPMQRMEDFMQNKPTKALGEVLPTYPRGVKLARAEEYLPQYITDSLREAFLDFEEWMPGFYMPDAVMTGAETRSTSPVRVMRDKSLEAVGARGLYPCGEGAGYAGGIVSAAADGIKCAEKILEKYN